MKENPGEIKKNFHGVNPNEIEKNFHGAGPDYQNRFK